MKVRDFSKLHCGGDVGTSRRLRSPVAKWINVKWKKLKSSVTSKILNSEFFFNSYVYYLTLRFIAWTPTFNFATRAFSLATRPFSLLTCGFELVARGFEFVTIGFELVTRGFKLVNRRFELVTRISELAARVLLFQAITQHVTNILPFLMKKLPHLFDDGAFPFKTYE